MIHTHFEFQKLDRNCHFYFIPTFWYEYDDFGFIKWHSICFAFANAIFKVDLEMVKGD